MSKFEVGDRVRFKQTGMMKFKSARYYALRLPGVYKIEEVRAQEICRLGPTELGYTELGYQEWYDLDLLELETPQEEE